MIRYRNHHRRDDGRRLGAQALRAEGDATLSERMEMLIQHRQSLREQIRLLQEHEAKLDEKIAFYQQEINKITDAAN